MFGNWGGPGVGSVSNALRQGLTPSPELPTAPAAAAAARRSYDDALLGGMDETSATAAAALAAAASSASASSASAAANPTRLANLRSTLLRHSYDVDTTVGRGGLDGEVRSASPRQVPSSAGPGIPTAVVGASGIALPQLGTTPTSTATTASASTRGFAARRAGAGPRFGAAGGGGAFASYDDAAAAGGGALGSPFLSTSPPSGSPPHDGIPHAEDMRGGSAPRIGAAFASSSSSTSGKSSIPLTRRSFDPDLLPSASARHHHGSVASDLGAAAENDSDTQASSTGVVSLGAEPRPRPGLRARQRFFSAMDGGGAGGAGAGGGGVWASDGAVGFRAGGSDGRDGDDEEDDDDDDVVGASSFPSLAALEAVLPSPTSTSTNAAATAAGAAAPVPIPSSSSTAGTTTAAPTSKSAYSPPLGSGPGSATNSPLVSTLLGGAGGGGNVDPPTMPNSSFVPNAQAPAFAFGNASLGGPYEGSPMAMPMHAANAAAGGGMMMGAMATDPVQLQLQMQQALLFQQQQWLLAMQQQQQQMFSAAAAAAAMRGVGVGVGVGMGPGMGGNMNMPMNMGMAQPQPNVGGMNPMMGRSGLAAALAQGSGGGGRTPPPMGMHPSASATAGAANAANLNGMQAPRNLHTTPVTTMYHKTAAMQQHQQGRPASGSTGGAGSGAGATNAHHQSIPGLPNPSEDPLLVEYKMTGKRAAVEELRGHVVAFALDSHGSRFLQYQMELAKEEDRDALVREVLPFAPTLMQDTFGNYVLQNFLEHASPDSRRALADTMRGSMLRLSMQAHGCRVVQRALDLVELDQRDELLEELLCPRGNVFQASRNTHATHVLQKTVSILRRECAGAMGSLPAAPSGSAPATPRAGSLKLMRAVESAIADDVVPLLLHPHAYRLVLNVLGDCDVRRSESVSRAIDTVSAQMDALAVDQHGNFMLQHMLDVGGMPLQRVHEFVVQRLYELAQHKFGSHLVEKCFSVANAVRCAELVGELLEPKSHVNNDAARRLAPEGVAPDAVTQSALLALMMDPYANFVVQRAIDRAVGMQRSDLVKIVQENAETLGRFTYGRHILGHVNALLAVSGMPLTQQQQQQQQQLSGTSSPGGNASYGRGGGGRSGPVPPNPRGYFPRQTSGGGGGGGRAPQPQAQMMPMGQMPAMRGR